jgi:hypothetical protein
MKRFETALGEVAYDERGSGPAIFLLSSGAHDDHDNDTSDPEGFARRLVPFADAALNGSTRAAA